MLSYSWTTTVHQQLSPWYAEQEGLLKTEETEILYSNLPNLICSAMCAEIEDGGDLKSTLQPLTKFAVSTSKLLHPSPG